MKKVQSQWQILVLLLFGAQLYAQFDINKGKQLYDSKDFQAAIPYFQAQLSMHPDNFEAIEYLGDCFAYTGDFKSAKETYKKLLTRTQPTATDYYKIGGATALYAKSLPKVSAVWYIEEIKRNFKKALELNPNHIDTHWALVELYMQLPGVLGGGNHKAEEQAKQLLKVSPVDGYLALGYIFEYAQEPQKAEYNYRKAVEIGQSNHCYQKLSDFYIKQNQVSEALKLYEKGCKQKKRNAFYYQLGKLSAMYDLENEKGLTALEFYIENWSTADGVPIAWARYRMAQIYHHKGDVPKAIECIKKALADMPDNETFKGFLTQLTS